MSEEKLDGTDEQLIRAFEECKLGPGEFGHADHVRLVWIMLERMPLLETLERLSKGIRRLANSHGAPRLYHETITWAFVLLIHERRLAAKGHAWVEFASENTDLLEWPSPALDAYYRPETLKSELARHNFVLPDRHVGTMVSAN